MRVEHEFVYVNKQANDLVREYKDKCAFVHVLGEKILILLTKKYQIKSVFQKTILQNYFFSFKETGV